MKTEERDCAQSAHN